MYRGSRPTMGMLLLLAVAACEYSTQPPLEPPVPQFDHDPATLVTNLADAGPGSLRYVVSLAPSGSTIHFANGLAGFTIVLNSPIPLPASVTIEGPESEGITISGGFNTTVFTVGSSGQNPNVTLRNLWIGGADDGDPFLGHGTAIMLEGGTLNVISSTLQGNQQDAIFQVGGDLIVTNSTISGNGEDGIQTPFGTATLRFATIANNGAHGLLRGSEPVTITSSLIANNSTDCGAAPGAMPNIVSGINLDSDDTCGLGSFDRRGVDPLLEPLADNGGPTLTHGLMVGSPAVDAAPCIGIVPTDQRGVLRPQGSGCDIGAYERIPISVGITINATGTVNPKTGTATITGTLTCSQALDVQLQVDLEQVQRVRRVPVPKQSSATTVVPCDGAEVSWTVDVPPPSGTAFVNGTAMVGAAANNADNPGATERGIRLFWAKK